MKTAISIWSCHKYMYDKTWTNADFIDYVGTTKAEGVELLSIFWETERDLVPVREALERNRLQLASFGACNNLAEPDEDKRKQQLQDILSSVDAASQLGAKAVRVFAGDRREGMAYEDAKDWILDGLKTAAAYAAEKQITLCLENHGQFAGRADQVAAIIREVDSPYLRLTFDTGNFLLVDQDPALAFEELKNSISHVHFKDFLQVDADYQGSSYTSLGGQKYAGKAPGEGIAPLPTLLKGLKGIGYNGWLAVEYEGDEEQKQAASRSVDHLLAYIAELD
jgi:sugar phosphate isomerase/epimerase